MIINENQGLIIKAIGGMYWIKTNTNTVICSARGSLRKNDIKPMVGDIAFFEKESTQSENGVLISIKERKNFLIRPIVSNIDNIFIISSIEKPVPNLLILDKLFAIAGFHDIKANLVITKTDLNDHSWLEDIYINSGFDVFSFSSQTNEGIDELKKAIKGKINVFIGNTGVGKSTTLNAIEEGLSLKTAEISEKLGRGRHTTRHTELFELSNGGFIADTPGFSTVDVKMYGITDKENLQFCFKEFLPYIKQCKYTGCSHTVEKGCEILKQVSNKVILQSRHNSYKIIYEELKQIKSWQLNK